jgi:phospholipid transport system transporter-binding protein
MQVNVSQAEAGINIEVDGELDRTTITKNLWESLSNDKRSMIANAEYVSISLKRVNRADTSGLAWLINAIRDIPLEKQKIKIEHIPQKLLDLAKLSNADQLISVNESTNDE